MGSARDQEGIYVIRKGFMGSGLIKWDQWISLVINGLCIGSGEGRTRSTPIERPLAGPTVLLFGRGYIIQRAVEKLTFSMHLIINGFVAAWKVRKSLTVSFVGYLF